MQFQFCTSKMRTQIFLWLVLLHMQFSRYSCWHRINSEFRFLSQNSHPVLDFTSGKGKPHFHFLVGITSLRILTVSLEDKLLPQNSIFSELSCYSWNIDTKILFFSQNSYPDLRILGILAHRILTFTSKFWFLYQISHFVLRILFWAFPQNFHFLLRMLPLRILIVLLEY